MLYFYERKLKIIFISSDCGIQIIQTKALKFYWIFRLPMQIFMNEFLESVRCVFGNKSFSYQNSEMIWRARRELQFFRK